MALPAAVFLQAGPYAVWEFWVHLLSAAAVVLGAAAATGWALHYLAPRFARVSLGVARGILAAALVAVAIALWVVGSPPPLGVRTRALAVDMAYRLAQQSGSADPTVAAPAWAQTATDDILANYAAYVAGHYHPPLPAGYRVSLVAAPNQQILQPLINHGDSAPLPDLARQVVSTLLGQVPVSVQTAVAIAHQSAVGVAEGLAVRPGRHTPVYILAIYVQAHG